MHSIDTNISSTDEWRDVEALASSITETSLRSLFYAHPERGSRFGVTAGELYVDLSRNLITDEVVSALLALARAADLPARRAAMFRATTLIPQRTAPSSIVLCAGESLSVDGRDVAVEVQGTLGRMTPFAERVRNGNGPVTPEGGSTPSSISVSAGPISGPRWSTGRFAHCKPPGIRAHYVSNVDPRGLDSALAEIDPETTLVVVASKTFIAQETLTQRERRPSMVRRQAGHGRGRGCTLHSRLHHI